METDDEMPDLRGEYWYEIPKTWAKRVRVKTGGKKHEWQWRFTEL